MNLAALILLFLFGMPPAVAADGRCQPTPADARGLSTGKERRSAILSARATCCWGRSNLRRTALRSPERESKPGPPVRTVATTTAGGRPCSPTRPAATSSRAITRVPTAAVRRTSTWSSMLPATPSWSPSITRRPTAPWGCSIWCWSPNEKVHDLEPNIPPRP